MNFALNLSTTRDNLFNVILMRVCRPSKMHHYISYFNKDKNTLIEKKIKMLVDKV